ncbi:hypothetical protein [Aliamphritea ceti]|uniref:hypothetical protein n=1 Tax=Aliamphritea ceti TaxID=1524258 RepID=UPI0021C45E9B|nr:hypothetical protein [Aliamphritea ceti]
MRYSLLILVLIAGLVQADSAYTIKKGVSWQGVKIGNQAPTGSDFVCRTGECYPLVLIGISARQMKQYKIDSLQFKELEKIALSRDGERITLPEELSRDLYIRAKHQALREIFFDAN